MVTNRARNSHWLLQATLAASTLCHMAPYKCLKRIKDRGGHNRQVGNRMGKKQWVGSVFGNKGYYQSDPLILNKTHSSLSHSRWQ